MKTAPAVEIGRDPREAPRAGDVLTPGPRWEGAQDLVVVRAVGRDDVEISLGARIYAMKLNLFRALARDAHPWSTT